MARSERKENKRNLEKGNNGNCPKSHFGRNGMEFPTGKRVVIFFWLRFQDSWNFNEGPSIASRAEPKLASEATVIPKS